MTGPRRPNALSRRGLLAGAAAVACLAGCGRKPKAPGVASKRGAASATLERAAAGSWRSAQDKARDRWRHPVQALQFWGLKPGDEVVEFWPGAGWYTDILAPFLTATHGRLYAANLEVDDPSEPAAKAIDEAYRKKLAARPDLYGAVTVTTFGARSGPVAPAGTADLVLFLRNVHNWMAGGIAEKALRDAYAALKPGGVLGVVEHRARPGGPQDPAASNGYVQEAYVKELAKEAGFAFAGSSEINANPKDIKDYPFGVWTLPPTRLSAPRGKPPDPAFDHAKYDAIGESDRMTLKFVKPAR